MSTKGIILFLIIGDLCPLIACSKDPYIPFYLNKKDFKPNLSELKPIKKYYLTSLQKTAALAFLKTLTNQSFITAIRFPDPLK
jgi:hypothetical protein